MADDNTLAIVVGVILGIIAVAIVAFVCYQMFWSPKDFFNTSDSRKWTPGRGYTEQ